MVFVSMRCGSVITHLSIKTPDIRVRYHLSDDRPDAQNAKLRRTVLVEVEVLAYTNREIGPKSGLLGLLKLLGERKRLRVGHDGQHWATGSDEKKREVWFLYASSF